VTNEHVELNFNAVWSSASVIQQPAKAALTETITPVRKNRQKAHSRLDNLGKVPI
jgi:hypothetical protein